MEKPFKVPPMDETHKLIIQSIRESNLFESKKVSEFVAATLDLFINQCDGLEFFKNYYDVDKLDMDLYFKRVINDRFDEKLYPNLIQMIEEGK